MSLYDRLVAGGLAVVDHRRPGYKNLTFNPQAVMLHHTASGAGSGNAPSLNTVLFGRPDLPGPLCHILIGRDGTIYAITDGYANHAGRVDEPWSNYSLVGIEIENDGVGEPYSEATLFAALEVVRVLAYGTCVGHKEICVPRGRKIDPSFDMDWFRSILETAVAFEQADRDIILTINHYVQKVIPVWLGDVEARLSQRIADAAAGIHASLAAYDGEEDAQFQAVLDAIRADAPQIPADVDIPSLGDALAAALADRLQS